MKRPFRTALPLSVIGLMTLAACGGDGDAGDNGTGGGADHSLSFAHVLSESQPWHTCGAVAFQDSIEDSDTGLSLELYPAAQTHADTLEQLDAIDAGNLDITWATPAQLGTRLDTLSVFDAAYLFADADHMMTAARTEAAEELWEQLRTEHGMRVIGIGYYGTRHLTANHPVTTPDDMSGVKLRVLDAPLWLDNGRVLGGQPTPVAFSELYLALQQGVVDAQENPLPVIEAQSFDEVQDYVSLTGHVVAMMAVVISEDTWNDLSEDQQAAVLEAGEVLGDGVTECTLAQEDELLEAWSGPDSEVTVHTDVDLDAFRERANEVFFPAYEDQWGEIYRTLQEQ